MKTLKSCPFCHVVSRVDENVEICPSCHHGPCIQGQKYLIEFKKEFLIEATHVGATAYKDTYVRFLEGRLDAMTQRLAEMDEGIKTLQRVSRDNTRDAEYARFLQTHFEEAG